MCNDGKIICHIRKEIATHVVPTNSSTYMFAEVDIQRKCFAPRRVCCMCGQKSRDPIAYVSF